jgi:hypothetical protein
MKGKGLLLCHYSICVYVSKVLMIGAKYGSSIRYVRGGIIGSSFAEIILR